MSAMQMTEHEPLTPLAIVAGLGTGLVGLLALLFKRWKGAPAAQDELNDGWRDLMEQMRVELKASHRAHSLMAQRLEAVQSEYAAERRALHAEIQTLREKVEELTRELRRQGGA